MNIIIIGSGGFSREVINIIDSINRIKETYTILGIISKDKMNGYQGYKYLGDDNVLKLYSNKNIGLVLAIGSSKIRKMLIQKYKDNFNFVYPNIVAPTASIGNYLTIGEGNIICPGNIFTVDYSVGNFNIINLSCTIGHDAFISDFVTINPGSNISGNVQIGECVEIGTGCKIIQGISLSDGCVLGAGTVIVNDTEKSSLYVGVPGKRKKTL